MSEPKTIVCIACGGAFSTAASVSTQALRANLIASVVTRHPEHFQPDGRICRSCLEIERAAFVVAEMARERGELSALEADVAKKASEHTIIAGHIGEQFARSLTRGQRIADEVARVGGSWGFVLGFLAAFFGWIIANSLGGHAFDPYPYILLNLVLSSIAALQAPVIMMSQNRSAARDRLEAHADYRTNLKAELEIAALHDKMDHLLHTQWERMVEMQQTQLDLLEELLARNPRR